MIKWRSLHPFAFLGQVGVAMHPQQAASLQQSSLHLSASRILYLLSIALQGQYQLACINGTELDNIKHIIILKDDRQWLAYGFNPHLPFASPNSSVDNLPSILF